MLIAHTELSRIVGNFQTLKSIFLSQNCLSDGVIDLILNFVAITLRF